MAYTDAQGRPELVADPQLKRGSAAWRAVAPDERQGNGEDAAAQGAPAGEAGEPAA